MSITLLIQPVTPMVLYGGGILTQILERAFGQLPLNLEQENLDTLNGILAAQPDDKGIKQIIEMVNEHGAVRIWPEG